METDRRDTANSTTSSRFGKGSGPARLVGALRRLAGALAFTLVIPAAYGMELPESSADTANLPSFVFQPLYADNQGSVYDVYQARHADLVLIEGGFNSGFQTGMVCRVTDGEAEVAEVMLVEVRNNCSAALILELEAGTVIEPGHSVRIKTVTF